MVAQTLKSTYENVTANIPTTGSSTYGYNQDGTKIWIKLHEDEVKTIGQTTAFSINGDVVAQTVAGNLDTTDGFGVDSSQTGLILGIAKGTTVPTKVEGWVLNPDVLSLDTALVTAKAATDNASATVKATFYPIDNAPAYKGTTAANLANKDRAAVYYRGDNARTGSDTKWHELLEVGGAGDSTANTMYKGVSTGVWTTRINTTNSDTAVEMPIQTAYGNAITSIKASNTGFISVIYCPAVAVKLAETDNGTDVTHLNVDGGKITVTPKFEDRCTVAEKAVTLTRE